jgi:predicted PolB exonuclease-like 3'-5' exonuclease
MKTTKDLSSIVFIDLETIPSPEKPPLSEVKVPANYSKSEAIAKYQEEHQEEEWRKQSLDPVEGRILCICAAVNNEEPVVFTGSEDHILRAFEDWFTELPSVVSVVAHNGKSFDYRFLFLRSLKFGRRYLINLFNGQRRDILEDTMLMLDGTGWKTMVSLDRAARLIGIEGKGGIKGSDVFGMWQRDEIQAIVDYCKNDVKTLRRVYYALKGE